MNDDLISRQAAIESVHHTIFGFFGIAKDNSESIISDAELRLFEINKAINNGIKALPSAEVFRIEHVFVDHDRDFDTMRDYFADGKVRRIIENAYEHGRLDAMRRGKWIFDGNFCGLNHHRCSECGKTEFRMSAYCPNCGAAMEGEDDAER